MLTIENIVETLEDVNNVKTCTETLVNLEKRKIKREVENFKALVRSLENIIETDKDILKYSEGIQKLLGYMDESLDKARQHEINIEIYENMEKIVKDVVQC